jgi:hypothetical protein
MTLRSFTSLSPCENEKDKNLESIERSLTLHKHCGNKKHSPVPLAWRGNQ